MSTTPTVDTSNYVFLCMTANGWGSAKTETAALLRCRREMGTTHIKHYGYTVYRVHPDFEVDPVNGSIRTPKGHPAIKVVDRRL